MLLALLDGAWRPRANSKVGLCPCSSPASQPHHSGKSRAWATRILRLRETGRGDNPRGPSAGWAEVSYGKGSPGLLALGSEQKRVPLAPELQRQLLQPLLGHVPGQEPICSLLATPPGLDSSPRGGRVPGGGSQGSLDNPVLLLANWDGIPNKHPLSALIPPADSEVVKRCQQRTLARMEMWPRGQREHFFPRVRDQSQQPASLAQGYK